MFYWDADTGTFKINEAKFHLNVLDEPIANNYAFDEYDCFQYSIDSLSVYIAALKVKGSIRDVSYKRYKKEYDKEYEKLSNCSRYKVKKALKNGELTRPKQCSICNKGGLKIFGHHEDYSKPLDVVWVCFNCHMKIHRGEVIIDKVSQVANPEAVRD
jgi:hypothetical protein